MAQQESTTDHQPSPGSDAYHGTRGAVGVDTSVEAAYADLVSGVTNKTQRLVLILAHQAGEHGITIAEIREKQGALHHGRMSSALTKHHIAGRLIRLQEVRDHCHVYVLPEFAGERETVPYRQQRPKLDAAEVAIEIGNHSLLLSLLGYGRACKCGVPIPDGMSYNRHVAETIVAEFGR